MLTTTTIFSKPQRYGSIGIGFNGKVVLYVNLNMNGTCTSNIAEFPFDVQNCEIKSEPSIFPKNLYSMSVAYDSRIKMCEIGNDYWDFLKISTEVVKHPIHRGSEYFNHQGFVRFSWKRRSNSYYLLIILAVFIVNVLAFRYLFKIQITYSKKVTVALTHILIMLSIITFLRRKLAILQIPFILYLLLSLCGMLVFLYLSTRRMEYNGLKEE
ncbi:unnamed protein product [Caenorhabditis angaria]|uniref:Neurotransmitter-gated ion-channel ligand-binding domain-containing protein n=1 Tax=Caenorhabditis angaria TaxID=860376 RepID=A0A9P1ITJ4_9PELO|nr:unnamed protein product [Caenorhabditis angaria]